MIRTQLFDPADIDNVVKIQAQYKMQPLSAFLRTNPPPAASAVDFIKPLTKNEQKTSLEFFNIMNFVLGYSPTVPSEVPSGSASPRSASLAARPSTPPSSRLK